MSESEKFSAAKVKALLANVSAPSSSQGGSLQTTSALPQFVTGRETGLVSEKPRILVRWLNEDILDVVWPENVDHDVMLDAYQRIFNFVGSKRLRFFLSDALQINSVSSPLSLREPCLKMLSFLGEQGLEHTVGLARSPAVRLFAGAVTLTTRLHLKMLASREEALVFFEGQRTKKK